MDDNNNIKKAPNVPPFLRYCSAIIPTAFDDSLSYYEALCALYKFLQNQVVTTINNNATVTEEYIQMTKDIKSYMDNYFENLDVQEEINNKLDEMAETGAFNTIIAQYTAPYIDALNAEYSQLSSSISTTVNQQNGKINALSNGSPIPVANISDMVDHTKTYLLTSDGNWYYYNGNDWVSGGVYQAIGLADESVTFASLDTSVRDVLGIDTLNTGADYNWEQGIIKADGTNGTDTSHTYWYITIRTANYIPLNQSKYLYFTKITNYNCFVFLYDDNNNLVIRLTQGDSWDANSTLIDLSDYPSATKMRCTLRQRTSVNPTFKPSDYDPSMYYMVMAGQPAVEPDIELDEYVHSTSDNLVTLPSLTFGTDSYASGQCLVGDYLISFGVSDDAHQYYKEAHIFKINKTQKSYELVRTVLHNFGHVNSVDYCEETDCLIFGNGSGAYGRDGNFAIYKGFKDIVEDNTVTTLNYSDCMEFDCSSVPFKTEDKWNVVWFDSDRNLYDLAVLVTNDLSKFRILQLGKGNNEFSYGTKVSVDPNDFNGTFQVVGTYEFDPSDTNDHVLQDMDYQSGKLYCGVSHNYPYYWVFKFDTLNETVTREIEPIYAYNDTGDNLNKGASAICCNDDYIILNTGYIIFKPRV